MKSGKEEETTNLTTKRYERKKNAKFYMCTLKNIWPKN